MTAGDRTLRIGLVGTSHWATAVHGAGLAAHPDVELGGVWGRDPQRAAAAAEALGCAAAERFEELLAEVDGVAFSVPPDVQALLALAAARAGKHLLLEKPLALDPAAADAVADAAASQGVATVVFLTRLWIPETAAWLDDLRRSGGWESGRLTFIASLPAGLLDSSPWRVRSGALWDVGPHALSVLERVLGSVGEVTAVGGARDLVHLVLAHEGGATSTAELTLTAPPEAFENRCTFWGPDGSSAPMPPLEMRPEHNAAAYAAAVSSLVRRARGVEDDGSADAAYGAHVTRVLSAAAAALRSARATRVREAPAAGAAGGRPG